MASVGVSDRVAAFVVVGILVALGALMTWAASGSPPVEAISIPDRVGPGSYVPSPSWYQLQPADVSKR